jgi:ubiquinol-cytochrome c reductase cytochrome c1 subunit
LPSSFARAQRIGFQWLSALIVAASITGYYKRFRFSPLKTRKITYN